MANPDSQPDRKANGFFFESEPDFDEKSSSSEPDSTLFASLLLLSLGLTILKQAHVLNWSWWWVSLPLWMGPAGLGLIVMGLAIDQEIKRFWRGW